MGAIPQKGISLKFKIGGDEREDYFSHCLEKSYHHSPWSLEEDKGNQSCCLIAATTKFVSDAHPKLHRCVA
jgi:hypothetical protein